MSQGTPEYHFIRHMKALRLAREWSQEKLTAEVKAVTGVQLNATAITKLEWALDETRATKARALRLNEAIAIADALKTTVGLLAHPSFDGDVATQVEQAVDQVRRSWLKLAMSEAERDLAELELNMAKENLLAVGHFDVNGPDVVVNVAREGDHLVGSISSTEAPGGEHPEEA